MTDDLELDKRLALEPLGIRATTPHETQKELWDTIQRQREREPASGGGQSLTTRTMRIVAQTGWLVKPPGKPRDDRLLASVHRAAMAIAAEATLALPELDQKLRHRSPTHLQRLLREQLKLEDLSPASTWGELMELGLEISYLTSYLADLDNARRRGGSAADSSKARSVKKRHDPLSLLSAIALRAAVFAAKTTPEREAEPSSALDPKYPPADIADPQAELAGLRARSAELSKTLAGVAAELKHSGRPPPGPLMDELDAYERNVSRLADMVDSAPVLEEIAQRLADRDPRRKALRALANLRVAPTEDDAEPSAVEDVRARAADALAQLEAGEEPPGLEPLLWLHDGIAHHQFGLPRPDTDAMMRQLLNAGLPTTLVIPPEVDRLRLGLPDGVEPTVGEHRTAPSIEPIATDRPTTTPDEPTATPDEPITTDEPTATESPAQASRPPHEDAPRDERGATAADDEGARASPETDESGDAQRDADPARKVDEDTNSTPEIHEDADLTQEVDEEEPATARKDDQEDDGRPQDDAAAPREDRPQKDEEPLADDEPDADDRSTEEVPHAEPVAEALLDELVERELAGIAACYLPADEPRTQALELLALACAAQSSNGRCAGEIAARVPTLIEALDTAEARTITFAAALRCAPTAPTPVVVELLESLRAAVADRPALSEISDHVFKAAQGGFEIGRDYSSRGRDPSTLQERSQQLADEARDWLARQGQTGFQRATLLWQQWTDERNGRLGRLLAMVVAGDPARAETLRCEVDELRSNLDRHLVADDRALRGQGSRPLQGRARQELRRRGEAILQLTSEAVDVWEALEEADLKASQANPWAVAILSDLEAVLTKHLDVANAEILAGSTELGLGSVALKAAIAALRRIVLRRESSASGPEPEPDEAMRGRLLASEVPLDDELRPSPANAVTEQTGRAILTDEPDWQAAFERRLTRGELHNARRIQRRCLLEAQESDQKKLGAQMESRLKRAEKKLTDELAGDIGKLRSEIDLSWRLGRLSHEACMVMFQELEHVEQRLEDPDAGLHDQLEQMRRYIARDASVHICAMAGALRERVAELGVPDETRRAIERFLSEEDIASAEDAIETLQRGEQPVLTKPEQHTADLRAFMQSLALLQAAKPSIEAVLAAARGEEPIANLDFVAAREAGSEAAVVRGIEKWFELAGGALLTADRREALREHVLVVLQMVGFQAPTLTVPSAFHTTGNVGIVEFELQPPTRWRGLAPQFGSEAQTLRVVLLNGEAASPDDLLHAARGNSELPCVAIAPRVLSLAQRRRIAELQRGDPGAAPVLFLDTAAFLHSCSRGPMQIATSMRILLPFTAVNPYMPFRGGKVPEEMFFGRSDEVSGIISRDGYSLIYGGRRLGKSALLEEAKRRADRSEEPIRTVVLDLKAAGIGEWNPPSSLLPLLAEQLGKALDTPVPSGRLEDYERLRQLVRAWLDEDRRRQLLVLLDETDAFLQADADFRFETTNRLHALQEEFQRRFKPVVTGLHQVKRFNDVPNQRLVLLGDKTAVGPLDTRDALQLIEQPLGALGFEFDPPSAAHRILAATRNQPSLIQLVCHHLLRHKLTEDPQLTPPHPITREDVEKVLAQPTLAAEIRERLELTINLDPRYRVILLVVALEQLERDLVRPLRAGEIRRECQHWWASGFANTTDYEFEALLGEMCELGVLYHRESDQGYMLQSPSISRLLGTPDNIMEALLRTSELRPPERFNAAVYHDSLDDTAGTNDPYRRSPLTVEQVQELCRRENRLTMIVGTPATREKSVGKALQRSRLEQSGGETRRMLKLIEKSSEGREREAFMRELRAVGRRTHKIALLDRSAEPSAMGALLEQSLKALDAKRPKGVDGSVCGVVLVRADSTVLRELPGIVDGDVSAERKFTLMPLRRWEAGGLRAWGHDEVELPFGVDRRLEELLEVTGGWPMLVNRLVRESRGHGNAAFGDSLRSLREHLESEAGARELVSAVGLDRPQSVEYRAWAGLVSYNEPIALTRSVAADIGTLADITDESEAQLAYETLKLMDALVIDEQRRSVAPEPALRAAWSLLDRTGDDGEANTSTEETSVEQA